MAVVEQSGSFHTTADVPAQISSLVSETAASLGRSFENYWPADEHNRNDPGERNVSLHFAHSLLSQGFSVFGEVQHCKPVCGDTERVDVLGIAPDKHWFIACEFKRVFSKHVVDLSRDMAKLECFWLNKNLLATSCGDRVIEVVRSCTRGFGLVGGLHWVKGGRRFLDFWSGEKSGSFNSKTTELDTTIQRLRATCIEPKTVASYPGGGMYHLVCAYFEIVNGLSAPQ